MKIINLSGVIYRIQSVLARSGTIAYCAARLRNQLDCVVGLHLGPTPDARYNGEFYVLDRIAPVCRLGVDVGANKGEWSARFLNGSSGKVHLYEPSREACQHLSQRLPDDRVAIHHHALGDREGEAVFLEDELCSQTSYIDDNPAAGRTGSVVRMSTLDREFGETEVIIDYLKIDAEGYDLKILHGCRDLLSNQRIRFIQFEYNIFWLRTGSSLLGCLSYLESMGYEVRRIAPKGLMPCQYELWGDFFFYSNFFACHRDDLGSLGDLLL